jgi:hypothetical protein
VKVEKKSYKGQIYTKFLLTEIASLLRIDGSDKLLFFFPKNNFFNFEFFFGFLCSSGETGGS